MTSRIIMFEEKHQTRYFDASTDEVLSRACVKVLRERVDEGYWYHRNFDKPERVRSADEIALMAMTDEQIAVLPENMAQDIKNKRVRIISKDLAYERNRALEDSWFAALEKVLSLPVDEAVKLSTSGQEGAGWPRREMNLAFYLLDSRSDYEYERLELLTLEKA